MTHDSRIPAREVCVVRYLLDRAAAATPDKVFVVFHDGRSLTYAALRELVRRTASGLQALGVQQGDHVAAWLPNDLDALRVFIAANYIGATFVPINTAYRGSSLEHALNLSDAKLLVLHADLAARLDGLALSTLEKAVVLGGEGRLPEEIARFGPEALAPERFELRALDREIEPWDTLCITYTSGTTGPAKAVMSSYAQYYALSSPESSAYVRSDDRYLISTPLFHVSSAARVYAMLLLGGSIAMVNAFRTEDFWSAVRETGSTTVTLMGAMATFLLHRPPSTDDRAHGLRTVAMLPLIDESQAFAQRFGVDIYTFYNMTETSRPLVSALNPHAPGSCGKARPGVEVRLVDDNDGEVPSGAVGELLVRTDAPWAMSHGYHRDLAATAKAWRNGWFHTGDALRQDADGNFYFVDRLKDCIRRRGENISSFQVESEIAAHGSVREVAAFPVPSEHGEWEVMVAVSLRQGHALAEEELIKFLVPRMPYFMVPRFIRIMEDLPKTPTLKIEKHVLQKAGVSEATFDREKAGIQVKRERIGGVA